MITVKKITWSCFLLFFSICSAQQKKPNFVIIIADDHGVFHSTPYGSTIIETPNMQKLADEGMRFDNAYVASPACGPSRASLFTGMMPYNNGIVGNHEKVLKPGVLSLIPGLIDQGYEVVFQGKIGHGKKAHYQGYVPKGVTILDRGQRRDLKLKVLEDYLKNRKDTCPIALFVGFTDTHTPFPPVEQTKIKPKDLIINTRIYKTPEAQVEMSRYLQGVQNVDIKFGNALKMANRYLDTSNMMTVYTSDHGMPWPFGKWSLYETGIRAPLIVSWPGKIKPNTTTTAMVSWIDLIPTLIDIAGGNVSKAIDGKSFAEVLLGKKNIHRKVIYATHKGAVDKNVYPIRSVRVGNLKYIRNLHPEFAYTTITDIGATEKPRIKNRWKHSGQHWESYIAAAKTDPAAAYFLQDYHSNPAEELYRIDQDPFEENNLAAKPEYAKKLDSLRQLITKRMKEVNDDESLSGPPKLLENFSIIESTTK
ncbi:sulfatase family protein [Algibacter lectus]|uniref:sulfatase family protein n=1 Tax=Algibacter lectus TaxID=221126 RepID=UPI002494C52B|nr:sulfatase [Algibacter lectus]